MVVIAKTSGQSKHRAVKHGHHEARKIARQFFGSSTVPLFSKFSHSHRGNRVLRAIPSLNSQRRLPRESTAEKSRASDTSIVPKTSALLTTSHVESPPPSSPSGPLNSISGCPASLLPCSSSRVLGIGIASPQLQKQLPPSHMHLHKPRSALRQQCQQQRRNQHQQRSALRQRQHKQQS
jgi:hypothetical protein